MPFSFHESCNMFSFNLHALFFFRFILFSLINPAVYFLLFFLSFSCFFFFYSPVYLFSLSFQLLLSCPFLFCCVVSFVYLPFDPNVCPFIFLFIFCFCHYFPFVNLPSPPPPFFFVAIIFVSSLQFFFHFLLCCCYWSFCLASLSVNS